jgi:hypothetical protein
MKKETFFFEGDPEFPLWRGEHKCIPTEAGIASYLKKNTDGGIKVNNAESKAYDIEKMYSGSFPIFCEVWKGKFTGPKVFVVKGCFDEQEDIFYFSVHEERKPERLASDGWAMTRYPMGFRERRPRPGRDRW